MNETYAGRPGGSSSQVSSRGFKITAWFAGCRPLVLLGILALAFSGPAMSAPRAPVWRCGWFENPSPGNAWLTDREGEWVVGLQGGHQAEGDAPRFKASQWIRTNNHYGYGCACMKVLADNETREIISILSASARRLKDCEDDRALKKPPA